MKVIVKKFQVVTLTILAAFFLIGLTLELTVRDHSTNQPVQASDYKVVSQEKAYEVSGPLSVSVKLQRVYLDGEISEEVKNETIWAMEDFWAEYEDWQLVTQKPNAVVFQQHVDDISPLLKTNGYFGLTDANILTIFEGHPDAQKAIQSFYQIDVGKLESRQHQKLQEGIPIQTKENYAEVLETFSSYKVSP